MDDTDLCVEAINSILTKRGMPTITREVHRKLFDFPVEGYYRKLGFDLEALCFDALSREFISYYEAHRTRCPLHPGVRERLDSLRERGINQTILSAYEQSTLHTIIEHYALAPFFDIVRGHRNIRGESKIAAGAALIAEIQQTGQQIEDLVIIGDTAHDFEVAQAVGCACVLVSHGHHSPERLSACNAPVVHNLHELEAVLTQS